VRDAGVDEGWCAQVAAAVAETTSLTMELGARGLAGDADGMLLHATDYLDLMGVLAVAWQHLAMAAAAVRATPSTEEDSAFLRGKVRAAQYWIRTELPRVTHLAALCRAGEDSYARVRPDEL